MTTSRGRFQIGQSLQRLLRVQNPGFCGGTFEIGKKRNEIEHVSSSRLSPTSAAHLLKEVTSSPSLSLKAPIITSSTASGGLGGAPAAHHVHPVVVSTPDGGHVVLSSGGGGEIVATEAAAAAYAGGDFFDGGSRAIYASASGGGGAVVAVTAPPPPPPPSTAPPGDIYHEFGRGGEPHAAGGAPAGAFAPYTYKTNGQPAHLNSPDSGIGDPSNVPSKLSPSYILRFFFVATYLNDYLKILSSCSNARCRRT